MRSPREVRPGSDLGSGFLMLVVTWVAFQAYLVGTGIARFALAALGLESQLWGLMGLAGVIGVVYLFYTSKPISNIVAIGILLWTAVGATRIFVQRISGTWPHEYTLRHQIQLVGFVIVNVLLVIYLWQRKKRRSLEAKQDDT